MSRKLEYLYVMVFDCLFDCFNRKTKEGKNNFPSSFRRKVDVTGFGGIVSAPDDVF